MEKINTIIFSKDRACQLQLLLDSMKTNIMQYDDLEISVIVKYSNENYKKGYDILVQRFPEITFISQSDNFKENVMNLLETELKYTMFFVDDDIVYQKLDLNAAVEYMKQNEEVLCFSNRQGVNTNWCYTMQGENVLKPDKNENGIIEWNWSVHYLDAAYPWSFDSHIFLTKDIKKTSNAIGFSNPNTYEGNLSSTFEGFPKEKMAAFEHSKVVGVPINLTNNTHPNLNAQIFGMSTKSLNDKYLAGEVVDLEKLNFEGIRAAHQEIELVFKKYMKIKFIESHSFAGEHLSMQVNEKNYKLEMMPGENDFRTTFSEYANHAVDILKKDYNIDMDAKDVKFEWDRSL